MIKQRQKSWKMPAVFTALVVGIAVLTGCPGGGGAAPPGGTFQIDAPTQPLNRGDYYDLSLSSTVAGVDVPSNISWTLLNNPHAATQVTASGRLIIAPTHPFPAHGTATIMVQAAEPGDNDGGYTLSISVLRPVATSVTIVPPGNPAPPLTRRAQMWAPQFTVLVEGTGYPDEVDWSIDESALQENLDWGTMINDEGIITLFGTEPNNIIPIRATSRWTPAQSDTFTGQILTGPLVLGDFRVISVGIDHTMAIDWHGRLYTWGRGAHGQLGRGAWSTTNVMHSDTSPHDAETPALVPAFAGRTDWAQVVGGWAHTVALSESGELWYWGRMFSGNHGNLADANMVGNTAAAPAGAGPLASNVPIQIGQSRTWAYIASGHSNFFAITTGGELYAWGANGNMFTNIPGGPGNNHVAAAAGVRIPTTQSWRTISASQFHVLAITTNGELYAWGENSNADRLGQLGVGDTTNRTVPTRVGADTWSSVSAGNGFSMGIREDDALFTWGHRNFGRLGDGSATGHAPSPVRIMSNEDFWYANVFMTTYGVAVDMDRSLWTWGNNEHGQIGRGTTGGHYPNPLRIEQNATNDNWFADAIWVRAIAGGSFAFAIQADGSLWGWGHNVFGQLGVGGGNQNRPVRIINPVSAP